MSTLTNERLYNLLPAIYRQRDVESGEPLRALLAVMEQELVGIEQELGGLYDDWFIETCQEWVVPYMGDLLGVSGLSGETSHLFSQRGHVANAVAYRRRKGLPAILERVAQDMTGWNARAVEYFNLLARTQHLHNVRTSGRTFNLRDRAAIAHLNTPFEQAAHFVDVRRITNQRGKHNIPNLGLFLWRLPAFPITRSEPFPVLNQTNCYTFHPLGVDMPLFNLPQPKRELTERTGQRHVAALLTREALRNDLERYQAEQESAYFGEEPAFQFFVGDNPIPPEEIWVDDLTDWQNVTSLPDGFGLILDPELGRFAFKPGRWAFSNELRVSYAYGFSANIGGGPYDRRDTLAVAGKNEQNWVAVVSKRYTDNEQKQEFSTLEAAISAWVNLSPSQPAIIQITDNSTYDLSHLSINLSGNPSLVIEAADGMRPCLTGGVTVTGEGAEDGAESQLTLNGLLIGGEIRVDGSFNLTINHCTLVSGGIQQSSEKEYHDLQITISHSLLGALHLPAEIAQLSIQDSVIDSQREDGMAIAADGNYGPPTNLERVTVFGTVKVTQLTASESLFTEPVEVQQRQVGYVRFSYLPAGSQTPPRYRCQPEHGAQAEAIRPRFTATDYGQPAYAQLSQQCALELTTGAENGAEMGVYQHLLQPQRAANLKASLDEYLPIGLEAGIFYVT